MPATATMATPAAVPVTENDADVTPDSPAAPAVSVYVPGRSTDRLPNLATPLTADTIFVPASVAPVELFVSATVTLAELLTTLPNTSSTATNTVDVSECLT